MLNVTSDVVNTQQVILNLWKHECSRVIADRFVDQQDIDWFEKTVKSVIDDDFGGEFSAMLHAEPYFVDFMRDAPEITGNYNLSCRHILIFFFF